MKSCAGWCKMKDCSLLFTMNWWPSNGRVCDRLSDHHSEGGVKVAKVGEVSRLHEESPPSKRWAFRDCEHVHSIHMRRTTETDSYIHSQLCQACGRLLPGTAFRNKTSAGVLTCTQNALRQSEVKESGEFAIWADLAGFKWNEKSGQRASAARKRFGSCNRIYAPVEMPSSLRSELQITNRSDSLTRI